MVLRTRLTILRAALVTLILAGCVNYREVHGDYLRGMGFTEIKLSEADPAFLKAQGMDSFIVSRFVAINPAGRRVSGHLVYTQDTQHSKFMHFDK